MSDRIVQSKLFITPRHRTAESVGNYNLYHWLYENERAIFIGGLPKLLKIDELRRQIESNLIERYGIPRDCIMFIDTPRAKPNSPQRVAKGFLKNGKRHLHKEPINNGSAFIHFKKRSNVEKVSLETENGKKFIFNDIKNCHPSVKRFNGGSRNNLATVLISHENLPERSINWLSTLFVNSWSDICKFYKFCLSSCQKATRASLKQFEESKFVYNCKPINKNSVDEELLNDCIDLVIRNNTGLLVNTRLRSKLV